MQSNANYSQVLGFSEPNPPEPYVTEFKTPSGDPIVLSADMPLEERERVLARLQEIFTSRSLSRVFAALAAKRARQMQKNKRRHFVPKAEKKAKRKQSRR